MRKIIDGRLYDTRTATEIAEWSNGHFVTDFGYCSETLYRTPKGAFFIYGEGGARSPYAGQTGNMSHSGKAIRPVDGPTARRFAERHGEVDAVSRYWMPEEA